MLYSVYSMPNIILPFFGGLLVMYFGIRTMYFVFGVFLMLGQFIFALGGSYNSIYIMLLGRIIFGFGGESLNITQNAMICKWFLKSEIALPLGMTISISRLGSVLNDNVSPRLSTVKLILNFRLMMLLNLFGQGF
jgi:MFS family permease